MLREIRQRALVMEVSIQEKNKQALQADNPLEVVPHRDENGHGTFMAGIACGSYDEQGDFIGAAPG